MKVYYKTRESQTFYENHQNDMIIELEFLVDYAGQIHNVLEVIGREIFEVSNDEQEVNESPTFVQTKSRSIRR